MIRAVIRSLMPAARALVVTSLVSTAMHAQTSVPVPAFTRLDSIAPPPALAVPISVRLSGVPLRIAINEVAQRANVSIVFDPALAGLARPVTIDVARVTAARVLLRLLDGAPLQAMVSPAGSIVLTARARRDEERSLVGGTVRQPTGPLGGVHVALAGTRFESATDLAGRFTFGAVPAGDYMLQALRMGYAPVRERIHIGSGAEPLAVSMTPAAVPVAAVIVTPGYFGVMQPGVATAQALTRQQIETVPQLGEDVYRAIGRLPGVATTDFSAKFSVRGEPGDALAVTLDGLPLIEPFHLKDLGNALSIVDLTTLGGAELITGGPSAEYGDELAGVFRLHTIDPRTDRARASMGLSLTNLRGMAQGGFADGKGGWLISGRRGYLDLAFRLAKIGDSVRPKYNDVYAKVTYDLPNGGRLAVHALHAGDNMHYLDSGAPNIDSRYMSDYAWLTFDARLGPRIRQESVVWGGRLDWLRVGDMNSNGQPSVRVNDGRTLHTLGVRQDWSADIATRALLKAGVTLRHEVADYDYSSIVRRQSLVEHAIVARVDSATTTLHPAGDRVEAYVAQRLRPIDALTIEGGLRYDGASYTGDAIVSPRLNASWQPMRNTTFRASWGKHVQSQSVFGLQVEDGVRQFAPAERATQSVVGVEQALWGGLATRVEAYDRVTDNVRPRYVNAGTEIRVFPEVNDDRLLLAPAGARARGVEISVEREAGTRVDWAASYALASATQRVGGAWIPAMSDQQHALHVDWSVHPVGNAWRLSVSETWHTGWPYTPDVVTLDTLGKTPATQQPYFVWSTGPLLSQRVPAYQRIDARWTRFIDTRSGRVSLFVEVYNLLNTYNLSCRYTIANANRWVVWYTQGAHELLPRIPSFGINWEF